MARRRPRRSACWRAAIVLEGRRSDAHPRGGDRRLFRPASRPHAKARRHDPSQSDHPGRAARRLLRGDRLRPVVHVQRDADHQPRARQPRGPRRLRAVRAGRPVRRLAVPRPRRSSLPAMALVGWALQRFVLERSARAGLLVPVLSTFGLSIVIDNLLFQGFGADTRSLAPYIGDLCPTTAGRSPTTSRSASSRC